MILPPHIAKYITHFKTDYKYGHDKNYNNTCDDIYTVYFSKERTFIGFKYRKEWTKEYKFSRTRNKKDNWVISRGSEEFLVQMRKLQDNTWCSISSELYEKIKQNHPEYFL